MDLTSHTRLYFRDWDRISALESYKWEAMKHFKENYDRTYENLEEKIRTVFGKADNLLTSYNYLPLDVLIDFSKEDYGVLADEWAKLYREATPDCGLCKGVKEALDYFKSKGMTQIILSATEKSLLQEQLVPLGIASYFSETLALDNLYAVSKVELGKEWIKRNKPQKALFIGDTEHDFETAAAMGVDCVLIANGHQNKERLSLLGVPVMNSASDLIKLF